MSTTDYRQLPWLPALFAAAVLFVCADAFTTGFALLTIDITEGGEANPIIAAAINKLGVVEVMILKTTIGVAGAIFLMHCAIEGYPWKIMHRNWRFKRVTRGATTVRAYRMLWFLTSAHALIVINNLIMIHQWA